MLAGIVWDAGTLSIVGTFSVVLAAVAGGYWYAVEKARSVNDLKRRMIERGMSVEEIERVMEAGESEEE